ncbi:MAG: phosphatidylserine decarboxylase family protein [Syntrophales bacterium]|nr:phosphatidylserine decarboxylase family protein [Syntrophales bacterium]
MKDHKYHDSPIVLEGFPFIIPFGAVAVLAFYYGALIPAAFLSVITALVAWFFRNPERISPEGDKAVISPADGKVINIENVAEHDLLRGPCKKISIFMNIFNVHVNRVPYAGTVSSVRHEKGKFLPASLDKASSLNEKNSILIKTDEGREILTVQVAGMIARRIVCWLKEGMYVRKGERFGLIKFSSRLEVFLPSDSTVSVKVGDKVRAGETKIGYL